MDTILKLGDVFGLGAHNFNLTLLVPVTIVLGAVAVFMFGFKKAESPKFRKLVNENSSSQSAGSSTKRKKRYGVEATVTTSAGTLAKVAKQAAPPQKVAPKNELSTPKKTPDKKQHASKPASGGNAQAKTMAKGNLAKGAGGSGSNKKITVLDKRHNSENGDGGEWKTVITKKQKKQTDVPIATAELAEVGAKHAVQSLNKKQKDSPKAAHTKLKAPAAAVEVAAETTEATAAITVVPVAVEQQQQLPVETAQQQPAAIEQLEAAAAVTAEVLPLAPAVDTQTNNLAFDELDDAWTENKTQKKSKKRALKEH